tara:strand:+ start:680 stop:841 length:162 start_codon:yes stop_codon:yes gene_type:complete
MSCKYKYFIKNDPNKETVGIVEAKSNSDAEIIAAKRKKIKLESFTSLFSVEKI